MKRLLGLLGSYRGRITEAISFKTLRINARPFNTCRCFVLYVVSRFYDFTAFCSHQYLKDEPKWRKGRTT